MSHPRHLSAARITAAAIVAAAALGLGAAWPATGTPARAAAGAGPSADWPQWRGPNRDGVAPDPNALGDASAPPKKLWSRDLGLGYSSAAVRGGRLYSMGWAQDQDTVWCLDAASGEVIWRHAYPAKRHNNSHEGGPTATPSVGGDRVFTMSRGGEVLCLNAADGQPVWSRDLVKEAGVKLPNWSFSGSTLLVEGAVIVDAGKTLALDPATGQTLWETKDYGSAYSSPVAFENAGRKLLAVFNGTGLVVLTADGKEVAVHPWKTSYGVNAATPAVIADRILIASGYGTGAALLKLEGESLRVVWQNKDLASQLASPVVLGGHIYGFDEGVLTCLELDSGKVKWRERGLGKGSLVAAGGKLVILSERGDLVLAEASPAGYKSLSSVKAITDGTACWTAPVVAGGRVYCRGAKGSLVCFATGGS